MPWYEWLISILLFIVSLGILVTIHELGHFSMAKLFKVYCHEFSIGFGPALLHKKREGKETYFSIRAVPLGGYVSMFGEEGAEPAEGLNLPPERSLEGIKKWKKAIVVSAGVILNAVLALVLIGISDICFPLITYTTRSIVAENSIAEKAGIANDDHIEYMVPKDCIHEDGSISPISYEYTDSEKLIHAGNFYVVDTNIEMVPDVQSEIHHYVLGFVYTGNKNASVFTDGMVLFSAIAKEDLASNVEVYKVFKNWSEEVNAPDYYPDFTIPGYVPGEKTTFDATIKFTKDSDRTQIFERTITFTTESSKGNYVWKNIGLSFATSEVWLPFGERVKATFVDFGNASIAVFKGLGVLFTGGIKNMSGIIGIFETSAQLFSSYTFATYLYFWGMISVNLAIFNLLPFPGLDGWQLLVTAVEGISKKKIPNKFKQTMSLIGLALLFVLMIAIVVLDVMRIAGV